VNARRYLAAEFEVDQGLDVDDPVYPMWVEMMLEAFAVLEDA